MKTQQSITGKFIQFNERRRTIHIKWLEKFRDPSFREKLWGDLLLGTFVSSLIFLIAIYIMQVFIWT